MAATLDHAAAAYREHLRRAIGAAASARDRLTAALAAKRCDPWARIHGGLSPAAIGLMGARMDVKKARDTVARLRAQGRLVEGIDYFHGGEWWLPGGAP